MSLHYNDDNIYLFVNEKEIFKFKADNKNVHFPTQFCLGGIFNGFSPTESREGSLVQGQLLPRKFPPSPKSNRNPDPNVNSNRGQFSSGAILQTPVSLNGNVYDFSVD